MAAEIFRKRPGTTSRGKEYEDLIVADLVLKLVNNSKISNFQISSNDENYGSFDDVVLKRVTADNIIQIQAIQLKHVNKEKVLTKNALADTRGNFSITKYLNDYNKLHKQDSNTNFILFTNLKLNFHHGEKLTFADGTEVVISKVQTDPILNTCPAGLCFKFHSNKEEYINFFNNFYLYSNQANVDEMITLISKRFDSFSRDKFAFKEYLSFINEWSVSEKKKAKLDLEMMKKIVTLSMLTQNIVFFEFKEYKADDIKKELIRKALSKFNITVLKEKNMEKIKSLYFNGDTLLKNSNKFEDIYLKYQFFSKHSKNLTSLGEQEKTKLLWLIDEFPLIVKANNITKKLIKLCGNTNIIILSSDDTEILNAKTPCLFDLKFMKEEYEKIVSNFHCSIQGKTKISLRHIIEHDEEFSKIITINELLQMLDDPFTIGEEAENLPIPYIPRLLSKNTIDFSFLDEIKNDSLVIISCQKQFENVKNKLLKYKLRRIEELDMKMENQYLHSIYFTEDFPFTESNSSIIYISDNFCLDTQFEQVCQKNPKIHNFHHLKVVSGKLEWIKTKGNIQDLDKYRIYKDFIKENEFISNLENEVQLICSDPGMGKSMLMKSIKNQQPAFMWTFMIFPKEYSSNFENVDETVEALLNSTYKSLTKFDKNFLRVLFKNGKITFIWDGLDEVSSTKINTIIHTIKKNSQKYKQIVTARCNFKKKLETEFNVLARKIKSFDEEEQKKFISDRLNLNENNDTYIIGNILKNVKMISCGDIFGVPLHIYMLTELLIRNWEKYANILKESCLFSITDIYHHFVEEKFYIYFKDKAKLDVSNDSVLNLIMTTKKDRLDNYKKISLNLVFQEKTTQSSFSEDIRQNGDCFGILLNVNTEGIPTFIHQSFGEYFVATYLVDNHEKVPNLCNLFFNKNFDNIRLFFDMLLAKDCPAHIAVLYKNIEMLKTYERDIHKCDKKGRTPFHLACSWGVRYQHFKKKKINFIEADYKKIQKLCSAESPASKKILEFLSLKSIPYQIDELFHIDVFGYANKSSSLYPMLYLCKTYKRNLTFFKNFNDLFCILMHSLYLDYTEIFDIPQMAKFITDNIHQCIDSAFRWNSQLVLKKLLSTKTYSKKIQQTQLPLISACKNRSTDVLQLLAQANINFNVILNNGRGMTPLSAACAFGHLDVVKLLIEHKADINFPDTLGRTPLFVACCNGRFKIFEFLIAAGAKITPAKNSVTLLHATSISGSIEIARILLKNNIDVNTCTDSKLTPLHYAVSYGQTDMVGFLLDNGATVDSQNLHQLTPLHLACANKSHNKDIILLLLSAQANVNAEGLSKIKPLFIACIESSTEIIQILLKAGADVNALTCNKKSALHVACEGGKTEVVQLLLEAGANPKIRNMFGSTARQIAYNKKHSEIVSLIDSFERNTKNY